jgi:hypothetical protein
LSDKPTERCYVGENVTGGKEGQHNGCTDRAREKVVDFDREVTEWEDVWTIIVEPAQLDDPADQSTDISHNIVLQR